MAGSRSRVAAAVAALLALGGGVASAATPLEVVRRSNEAVLRILAARPVVDAATEGALLEAIDAVTDFERLTASVVEPFCGRLAAGQCEDLKATFERLLRVSSIKKLGRYRADGFEYLGESTDGGAALVRTVAAYGQERVPLDYQLARRGDGWVIVNYVVDGIDTARSYRKQFTTLFGRETFEGVLARLKRKIAEHEAGE